MPEKFDIEKFKQVLHHIINKTADKPQVGKTVLYKMLYFIDFDFYELNEKSLTGETYHKIQLGPAPPHFDAAIKKLKEEGKIKEIRSRVIDYTLTKFIPTKEPASDLLSATEIRHIDSVVGILSGMKANQAVAYTHRDMPVKATEEGDVIDYELVFYRDDMFSVREYDDEDDNIRRSSRVHE